MYWCLRPNSPYSSPTTKNQNLCQKFWLFLKNMKNGLLRSLCSATDQNPLLAPGIAANWWNWRRITAYPGSEMSFCQKLVGKIFFSLMRMPFQLGLFLKSWRKSGIVNHFSPAGSIPAPKRVMQTYTAPYFLFKPMELKIWAKPPSSWVSALVENLKILNPSAVSMKDFAIMARIWNFPLGLFQKIIKSSI